MTSPTFTPRVEVSWDGSGAFTGPYDDVTADVVADPGVAIDDGLDGARALNQPKVSAVDLELFNHTGKYSQERADSPLYQRILPGRPVRVTATHGARRAYRAHVGYRATVLYRGLATYPLARTFIDDLSQETALGGQRATLRTVGLERSLVATTVSVPVVASVRVDQAIALVLDAAGWPSDLRDISVSDTLLSWFWVDDRPPWSVILELLAAEGPGVVDVDRAGVFRFQNRHYRTTAPRSVASVATIYDRAETPGRAYRGHVAYRAHLPYRGGGGGLYATALRYEPGWSGIYNRATYPTRRRAAGTTTAVWTYGASLALAPGEVRTLIARPADPFIDAVAPVLGTDYAVTGGTVAVSLASATGVVAFITVAATGGAPTVAGVASSPGLALRARPLAVVSETTVANTIPAADSIDRYSPIPGRSIPRVLQLAGWPEVEPVVAEAVCNAWVARLKDVHPTVTLALRNVDARHLRLILEARVSDRVTVVGANPGIADDVWVNATRLLVAGQCGADVRAELACEKVTDTVGSLWDGPTTLWDSAVWAD